MKRVPTIHLASEHHHCAAANENPSDQMTSQITNRRRHRQRCRPMGNALPNAAKLEDPPPLANLHERYDPQLGQRFPLDLRNSRMA
jgi:hypothetical protein